MCALYGWLDFGKKIKHKYLQKLTQALANAAEERGTDAAGIAYVYNGHIAIYKRPKPAHKLHFYVPDGTTAVMGHTRMATQGDKRCNWNNHPFHGHAGKDFAFAHNGVLYNDSTLRKLHELPITTIETDSYVGVQLIEKQGKLDFDSLKFMAEAVSGTFVFTTLDEDNNLYFVKGDNPLYLLYFERLGLYVYASTKSIMDKALKAVGMQYEQFIEVRITEGDIIKIENDGRISKSEFDYCDYTFFGRNSRSRYYNWRHWWALEEEDPEYDAEEELLLSMCGSLGVDEEDVTMLLEYGYDAMEIEELLLDHDSFEAAVNELKFIETVTVKQSPFKRKAKTSLRHSEVKITY